MTNDVTKKYREAMAFVLLGVAVLAVIAALSLLFKSSDDLGGSQIGFPEKSAAFGSLFESGLLVFALVGAVFLVTRLGDLSSNARIVVLAAMGIGGVDLLFAVITFFAQFGADSDSGATFAGVLGAGKVVGAFLSLAQLGFLGVGLFYIVATFQSLPAPVAAPAPQWGSEPGYGAYGGQHPGAAPGQQPWRQPDPGHGQQPWGQQGWAQPGGSPGWASPSQAQQPAWGQPPATPAAGATAWPQPDPSGWGQQQSYAPPSPPAAPEGAPSPWAAEGERPAPFWGPPEVAHVQPADVPDAAEPSPGEDSEADVTATDPDASASEETGSTGTDDTQMADDKTQPVYEETQRSGDDTPPPAQGWWQDRGQ